MSRLKLPSKEQVAWKLVTRLTPVVFRTVLGDRLEKRARFSDPQAKSRYVNSMFGKIAGRYDFLNRVMSLWQDQKWRELCVMLAQPKADEVALDVATGTADFAIELARQGAGRVIGIDITEPMLDIGRTKVESLGLSNTINLRWGDALDLEFKDNYFGCVTTGFAMRNVTSIQKAFEEMRRVLKPGGRVVCLELTHPKLPVWKNLYYFYFYRIVPVIGGILAGQMDAYTYLPNSLTNFPDADGLATIMRKAGFEKVAYRTLMLGTVAVHVGIK